MTSAYRLHRDAALRTGRRRPPAPGPVQTVRVVPALWAEALRRAEGNARRIEIQDEATVIVRNKSTCRLFHPKGA